MNNLDSFHTACNKRPWQDQLPPNESREVSNASRLKVHLKTLDVPLISATTGCPCDTIILRLDHPCTIGRNSSLCEYVFRDYRISKRHCQIFCDSVRGKIYISDGAGGTVSHVNGEEMEAQKIAMVKQSSSYRCRNSLNGVFVNGIKIQIDMVAVLSPGDEILLAGRNEGHCSSGIRIGFVVEKVDVLIEESTEVNDYTLLSDKPMPVNTSVFAEGRIKRKSSKCDTYVKRGKSLLRKCRRILHSDEPIAYLQRISILVGVLEEQQAPVEDGVKVNNRSPISLMRPFYHENSQKVNLSVAHDQGHAVTKILNDGAQLEVSLSTGGFKCQPLNSVLKESVPLPDPVVKNTNRCISVSQPGKKFYLNCLKSVDHGSVIQHPVISLCELLYPVETLTGIFIATFTSDILWFLSYCEIPNNLPVTIACHNTERCWSSNPQERISMPYSDFPNLVVVNPPFPEAVAFGNDRKKHGIACHHPKLFVLLRKDQIRVVITSANLVEKQWNSITNTVWWQDFPCASSPDHLSLFSSLSHGHMDQDLGSDFAAQLAGFMASLVVDIPSQAHWILKLAKYNFKGAVGHLVASIPGMHFYRSPCVSESMRSIHARSLGVNFLGSVEIHVVGLSHLFHSSADSNGEHLRKLASFLGKCCQNAYGMLEVVLRRNTHIPADVNAVSVLVPNPDEFFEGDCIQLGFLPRDIAKWVSPLWDGGFFKFSGHICAKEALSAALGENDKKVQLTLYISQGPNFSGMSKMMQSHQVFAFCSLIASIQRCVGLWRLEEILGRYKWPELQETEFFYGSSSFGTAVNAQFMAAFAAAIGKRSAQFSDSQESDPEWGGWNTSQESRSPSIKIIFPTINRVKSAICGIWPSKRILCFQERTWQRLRSTNIFHDAIPHPYNRIGHPLHVKVAQRRFQSKRDATSFGWVYCGSHNFSAAAWGRPILTSSGLKHNGRKNNSSKSLKLHVCNYELGIIFLFPPADTKANTVDDEHTKMDDIIFPFVVPAPKYGPGDKPATAQAMREAFAEYKEQERENTLEASDNVDIMEEIVNEEDEIVEATDCNAEEKEEEKAYAEMLWSQVDSSQSC